MKKWWHFAVPVMVVLGGVLVLLLPTLRNRIALVRQDTTIRYYERRVDSLSAEETASLWEEARAYNGVLADLTLAELYRDGPADPDYLAALNLDGVMGYVDIPAIEVSLPIYHGVGDEVLRKGAGHLFGSDLPIGGAGTHTVLTSHSGLPSARLFTDLEQLVLGDIFTIRVLDATLAYRVDQILVVEPHEIEAIRPLPDEDHATLITCTPYAINSHRLLVRGVRFGELDGGQNAEHARYRETVGQGRSMPWLLLMAAVVAAVTMLAVWRRRRKRTREGA